MTPSDFNLASSAEIMQALGQRLREQRLAKLMTQEELSRRAGVALGAVKKLESSGKVTLETLVQVARVLGLVNGLSGLFAAPAYASIADMERHAAPKRQRARKRVGVAP